MPCRSKKCAILLSKMIYFYEQRAIILRVIKHRFWSLNKTFRLCSVSKFRKVPVENARVRDPTFKKKGANLRTKGNNISLHHAITLERYFGINIMIKFNNLLIK